MKICFWCWLWKKSSCLKSFYVPTTNAIIGLEFIPDKKVAGKSKAEQMNERQQELERRLQDVTGQLGSGKKNAKKGELREDLHVECELIFCSLPTEDSSKVNAQATNRQSSSSSSSDSSSSSSSDSSSSDSSDSEAG